MSKDNPLSEDSRVVVRIWTSRDHPTLPGDNVGHISLETQVLNNHEYMSFWPLPFTTEQIILFREEGKLEQKTLRYFQERGSRLMGDYADDFKAEGGRKAQVTIVLYGLDAGSIVNKFNSLKDQATHWRLLGGNKVIDTATKPKDTVSQKFFSNSGEKVENCASFAYTLLKEGGLYSEISSSFSSRVSVAATPDKLLDAAIEAKRFELKKHPETSNFNFAGETDIEQLKSQSSCVIS